MSPGQPGKRTDLMNISFFSDWIEDRLFGEGEVARCLADVVDEAMARDTPGESDPAERVDEGQLEAAWAAAQNEDETIRARTAIVLGRLGHAPVEETLRQARTSGDSMIRGSAAAVLARIHGVDDSLLEPLVQTVKDPALPRELRNAAAKAIAKGNTPVTTGTLVDISTSEDSDLAQYGLEGLGWARPEPRSPERQRALEALLAGLQSKDITLKLAAAEALGNFGDRSAIKDLEMVLIEKDATLRRRSLFALAKLAAESAKAPLIRMLRDFAIPARWEIVDLVGQYYGESMVDAFSVVTNDGDAEIRDHVVAALARMDGPGSYALLQKMATDDEDSFVREQAESASARRKPVSAAAEPAAAAEPLTVGEPPRPPSEAPPPPPGPAEKLLPLYGTTAPAEAPASPETKEPANVIERALEAMDCSWRKGPQGYEAEVPLANVTENVAILLSETDYEGSPIYRFMIECGPAQAVAYEAALRNNRHLDYGSLAIADGSETPKFVLTETMLAGSATIAGIRKMLMSLVRSAARLHG